MANDEKILNAFVCIYWNNQTSFLFYSVNYMDWFFLILCQPYSPWIHPTWSSCIIPFLYLTRFNLPIFSLIEKLKFTITNYSLKKWNTKQQCGNFLVSELFIVLKYVCVSCSVRSDSMILQTVAHQPPPTMGILQARILEWVAFLFSRGSAQPRDQTCISCIAGGFLTIWATREVHKWFLEKELLLKTKY